jgi:recombination protein RecA
MDFLKEFEKKVEKMDGVTGASEPPRYWYSFGNYVLNYIMSGDFKKGVPQGRVTGLTGPSGAGKSFILGNVVKSAQDDGAFCFIIDSEEALDDDFMTKIGVDVEKDYMYKSAKTIPDVQVLVQEFIKLYSKQYGNDVSAPHVLIGIDSLDMLMTESEESNYNTGKFKGDQGQRNKQLKQMLRGFVQDLKGKNISIVVTSQVYQNQDLLNGEGLWIVSQSIRYSMSQIALFTKKKLKGDEAGTFSGIKLVAQGFKTRFTKPFQKVEIEVPYDTGINPYFGLLDVAITQGVVTRGGAYYQIVGEDEKFMQKNFPEDFYDRILDKLCEKEDLVLTTDAESDDKQVEEKAQTRRARKAGLEVTDADVDIEDPFEDE